MYASVDLPEPLGPISAWISPLSSDRSSPLRISRPSTSTWRSSMYKSWSVTSTSPLYDSRFRHGDLDEVTFHYDVVRRHGTRRREYPNGAVHYVETRPVQRAFHLEQLGVELTIGEIGLLVRAIVADRIDIVAHSIEADGLALHDDLLH